jgi:hypothetical protein
MSLSRYVFPLAALLLAAGCGKKPPTEAECEKFADHMTQLTFKSVGSAGAGKTDALDGMLAKVAQQSRQQYVQTCKQIPTRALYDCMMKAASVNELPACSTAR